MNPSTPDEALERLKSLTRFIEDGCSARDEDKHDALVTLDNIGGELLSAQSENRRILGENERLRAENEQLTGDGKAEEAIARALIDQGASPETGWKLRAEKAEAEVERLRAELAEWESGNRIHWRSIQR